MEARLESLLKVLSSNDVGATGSHQAGIVVPREERALAFFPLLDVSSLNPRVSIPFADADTGAAINLNFIYYNGKTLGSSTRNEYRLTGMSRYLREHAAKAGDSIEFRRDGTQYSLAFKPAVGEGMSDDSDIIVLSGTWKTIKKGRFL